MTTFHLLLFHFVDISCGKSSQTDYSCNHFTLPLFDHTDWFTSELVFVRACPFPLSYQLIFSWPLHGYIFLLPFFIFHTVSSSFQAGCRSSTSCVAVVVVVILYCCCCLWKSREFYAHSSKITHWAPAYVMPMLLSPIISFKHFFFLKCHKVYRGLFDRTLSDRVMFVQWLLTRWPVWIIDKHVVPTNRSMFHSTDQGWYQWPSFHGNYWNREI